MMEREDINIFKGLYTGAVGKRLQATSRFNNKRRNKLSVVKRLNWIDVSKGICMLAVIVGHMGNDTINKIVFPFHLTVFFILSGYTLKENKMDKEYLSVKFKRLMVPYFCTCFFIVCMDIFNILFIKHNYTIHSISNIIINDLIRTFFASGAISNFASINLKV